VKNVEHLFKHLFRFLRVGVGMRQLVIEYVLEGHQRGYNFTSSTQGFHDDVLKSIWRRAMPRGQGWGAAIYAGARSIKTFLLEDGRAALSEVVVTDMRDESGRGGIRRAVVSVMQAGEYLEVLQSRLGEYADPLRAQIERRTIPSIRGEKQIILSHPYMHAQQWQMIEALMIRGALRLASDGLFRSGRIIPFTTLALDYRDEGLMVALPEEKARRVEDERVFQI
jgi:hypothetical protein